MWYLSEWFSKDRRVLLCLSEGVLSTFELHAQTTELALEAGGILLGYVRGQHLEIILATEPTPRDKRTRTSFERMPYGHDAIAEANWVQSEGTIRYLGEWHTHPEDIPEPSPTDRREWPILANKRLDGRPLLAVIVGRRQLHIELASKTGARIKFQPLVPTTEENIHELTPAVALELPMEPRNLTRILLGLALRLTGLKKSD